MKTACIFLFVACMTVLTSAMRPALPMPDTEVLRSIFGDDLTGKHPNTALCIATHCAKESMECGLSDSCRKAMSCSAGCMQHWNDDPDPRHFVGQNCTTKCAASYEDKAYDDVMGCWNENNCVEFPATGNVKCANPEPDPKMSLASLEGEFWQPYGYNDLFDCYPCQHIRNMSRINETTWSYIWSYEVFKVDGSLKLLGDNWPLPDAPVGQPIPFTYEYLGTSHEEIWTMLGGNEFYSLVYVCSYMGPWTNVGSIVWVRPGHVLTDAEMTDIAATYKKKLGWNFPEDFCVDLHESECPDEA